MSSRDPSIPIAIRVIKLWAASKKLNNPARATLNSLGFLVMLLALPIANRVPSQGAPQAASAGTDDDHGPSLAARRCSGGSDASDACNGASGASASSGSRGSEDACASQSANTSGDCGVSGCNGCNGSDDASGPQSAYADGDAGWRDGQGSCLLQGSEEATRRAVQVCERGNGSGWERELLQGGERDCNDTTRHVCVSVSSCCRSFFKHIQN